MYTALLVVMIAAIFAALGFGLRALLKPGGDPARLVHSLSWRIGLSVALFGLLLLGFATGLLKPHGL